MSEEKKPAGIESPNPVRAYTAAALAWILPGSGHFLLGRKGRGAIYGGTVLFLFVVGLAVDGVLDSPRGTLLQIGCFFAEAGTGLPFILAKLLRENDPNLILSATFEHGSTYLRTAGLLNLVASLDAHDIGMGRKP